MNRLKTGLLLTTLTLLMVAMGSAFGGRSGGLIALVFAGAMNFGTWWYSDKIVLSMYKARPVTRTEAPQLVDVVETLASRAGLPMPRVYILPGDSPNAFATGRNPENAAVAATQGLLSMMTKEELEGVMAHELAHVMNRDTLVSTIAATLAGAISWLANMLQWAVIFGMGRGEDEEGGGAGGLLMAFIAPIAAMLIQMAVSRSREYLADATAARITGNPLGLAMALEKLGMAAGQLPMRDANPATAHMFIVSPLAGASIGKLFSTHPPIEERINRLVAFSRN